MTSTAAYQAYKLQTLGKTMSEIQEQIALLLSVSADQAAEIIQAAAEYGYNLDADRLGSSVSFADNVHAQQVTDAAVKLARRDLTNITQTIGFAVGKRGENLTSAYKRAINCVSRCPLVRRTITQPLGVLVPALSGMVSSKSIMRAGVTPPLRSQRVAT